MIAWSDDPIVNVRDGQWGVSRIVETSTRSYTTAAMQQKLADIVEAYYPPLVNGAYPIGYALVHLEGNIGTPNADTELLPRNAVNVRLGDLTATQRNRLRNVLETVFTAYDFTDFDGSSQSVQPFTTFTANYTVDTTLRDVAKDIFRFLRHSVKRNKIVLAESHNTEYTDDFATNPFTAPRWTNVKNTQVWDGVNFELDFQTNTSNRPSAKYSINNTGSIEHEAQGTFFQAGSFTQGGGGATRFNSTGALDWYFTGVDASDDIILFRVTGDALSTLTTFTGALVNANNDWITTRLSSQGTAGSNVVVNLWYTNHGTSKPSDPGWIGVDGSPNQTFTDSSANRLDDATSIQCGMGMVGSGIEVDTRNDFFKQRAITDRAGAASPVPPKWNVIITE